MTSIRKARVLEPGGVVEYIAARPKEVRPQLKIMRAAIRAAAPHAIETTSYFNWPGYAYEGYEYNGMFAWFSFKAPFVRLHIRPNAIDAHKKALAKFKTSRAVVNFKTTELIPVALVKKLVKASISDMKKQKANSRTKP